MLPRHSAATTHGPPPTPWSGGIRLLCDVTPIRPARVAMLPHLPPVPGPCFRVEDDEPAVDGNRPAERRQRCVPELRDVRVGHGGHVNERRPGTPRPRETTEIAADSFSRPAGEPVHDPLLKRILAYYLHLYPDAVRFSYSARQQRYECSDGLKARCRQFQANRSPGCDAATR